jgi:glycolate oxidase
VGTDDLLESLRAALGADAVDAGDAINPDDLHDESLHPRAVRPLAVLRPASTDEVATIARLASASGVPITPRGSGTGLSGAAVPVDGGLVVSFSRMNRVLHLDLEDHVAVVQPGLTLRELAEALTGSGLAYPVYPGELSGSLGGNVNTNAGGMRAVRHGVTRHHVLGLELVLIDGTVLRTGGPVVKSSSGYELTQLVIGSEGTLAMVTEITLRLSPQLEHAATVLVPFATLEDVTRVVPRLIASGLAPSILEYIDVLVMAAITRAADLELGVAADVAERTAAYLVIVLETRTAAQLDDDLAALAERLEAAGALDVYVLPAGAAARLIGARERAFWSAKAGGAHDIIDIVVPRSSVPGFLATANEIAARHGTFLTGCGHVGDGNVHLSIFQSDEDERRRMLRELFSAGVALGGAVSGEHGIGRDKQADFLALADPVNLDLQRAIKAVFDPRGLLNPHRLLDERPLP